MTGTIISHTQPGDSVSLGVLREGKQFTVRLAVADQADLLKKMIAHPDYEMLGVKVQAVTESTAKSIGLPQTVGVIVTTVVPGSPADSANVAAGDVIFRVGSVEVNDPAQFSAQISDAVQAGSVVFLLRDGATGQLGYLEVPLQ